MFDLRTEFYNFCRYPGLSAQPADPNARPDLELSVRLFAAGATIPAVPVLADFAAPIFSGVRLFRNEAWSERSAVSQDSCGVISNFLQWVTDATPDVDFGDMAKIGGYFVVLRKLTEQQLVTYRRINPVRDMRTRGARYGMFVTVDMSSTTFTPP